jgi:hypothetical protein
MKDEKKPADPKKEVLPAYQQGGFSVVPPSSDEPTKTAPSEPAISPDPKS